jgi:hypothetical protein
MFINNGEEQARNIRLLLNKKKTVKKLKEDWL